MLIDMYSDVVCPWCYIGVLPLEKSNHLSHLTEHGREVDLRVVAISYC